MYRTPLNVFATTSDGFAIVPTSCSRTLAGRVTRSPDVLLVDATRTG